MKNLLFTLLLIFVSFITGYAQGLHLSLESAYGGVSSGKYSIKDTPGIDPMFQLHGGATYEFKTKWPKLIPKVGVTYSPMSVSLDRVQTYKVKSAEFSLGAAYKLSKKWSLDLQGIYRRNFSAKLDDVDLTDDRNLALQKNQFGASIGVEYQLTNRLSINASNTQFFNPVVIDEQHKWNNNRYGLGLKFRLFK